LPGAADRACDLWRQPLDFEQSGRDSPQGRSTVGIGKQLKQHCGALETRFQREWDDAVNNDTIDRREAELSAMRREIDQLCNAK
jgi:hypothetical protein